MGANGWKLIAYHVVSMGAAIGMVALGQPQFAAVILGGTFGVGVSDWFRNGKRNLDIGPALGRAAKDKPGT